MDSEKDIPEYGALKTPKEQPHCEYCGMITWGDRCNCTQQPNMSRKIVAMFDMNADGRLTVEDLNIIAIRHEWMFVAGLFILVGSVGNVFGYWNIDSDAFWAAAGLAAMLEYVDDVRHRRRRKR